MASSGSQHRLTVVRNDDQEHKLLPRIRRKERVRALYQNDILDAALEVFSEHGYERAPMNAIAERAEVAIGSVYNLFPSKQALYEELVRRFTESFRSVALPALRDGHDEPATLRNYVRVNGEFVASNVKMARFYMQTMGCPELGLCGATEQLSNDLRDLLRARLAAVFQSGMDRGLFVKGDAYHLAVAFMTVTSTFVDLWLDDPDRHQYQTCATAFTETLLRGLLSSSGEVS